MNHRLSAGNLRTALTLTVLTCLGCAPAYAAKRPPALVPDAEGAEIIGAIKMGCNKPYELKDCGGMSGPKREITVKGVPLKTAGTEDGKVIMVWARKTVNPNAQEINTGYELIKEMLRDNGISILRVRPVASGKRLFGYAVETDKPAYQLLDQYAD